MNTTFERKYLNKEGTVEWFTPPSLIEKLGKFDLDPCTSINAPFFHAKTNYTLKEDGLNKQWFGRVWCNPPYGHKETPKWIEKLKNHGNGIALIFARTETKMFFDHIWNDADGIFFIEKRIKFYSISGELSQSAGAPSCLIIYGKDNLKYFQNTELKGKLIILK